MPKFVDHESRRAHVTEIAAELVAAEGRSALTARRVAEATGHSTTIVSHYFDDMAELMYETYRLAVRRSRSRVAAVLDADPTDIVGLAEAILPIDAVRKADWRIWIAFFGEALGSPALADEQRARVRSSADRFHACLQRLDEAGRVATTTDLRGTANRLGALIFGIAGEATFDPRRWTAGAQREAIQAELIAAGVRL
ncbi:MAG: TetR family transcriptional regulator C-terminal domain-containing protein [Acidimicrobiales bacterium]